MQDIVFHILHFRRFLEDTEPLSERLQSMILEAGNKPTPKFLQAVESNEDYLSLMRAYSEYIECTYLGDMCPIVFAGYRPNYARWMVRFYLNLVNMENSHLGIRHILQNGDISSRTSRRHSLTKANLSHAS